MTSVRAVLFTDVVGSTVLAASIGDTSADSLRRVHFASMRKVIEASGGYEVKTIGDAVMAGFDSAVAVVECAVRMQQAVAHENERSDTALEIRIGISMGEVADSDSDLFGMPVVEANRLCAATQGGHILAADVVRQLVGSRSTHQFERGAALDLKGLPAPLDTCEVLWSRTDVEPDWLPRRLADVSGSSCVGRDAELDTLRHAWTTVTGGRRQLALIAGEPGIGKTRLVAELARTARDAVVAYGWCDQESSAAFLPWVHIVSGLVRSHREVLEEALTPAVEAEISRLVPEMSGAPPPADGGDAETTRLLMFDAVDAVLTAISARQPVLVVLDDLHWADAGSLALIRYLLRSDRAAPLFVVGTYRDTDVDRTQPLAMALGDLRREPNATRLSLGGLQRDSVGSLIADRAGHRVANEFVDLIYNETGGHPFFTKEVLSHFVESGVVVKDAGGAWVTTTGLSEIGVPEGVRDVLGRRFSRLPADTNDALAVAAMIGREFDLGVLGEVLSIPQLDVVERLEPAAEVGLVDLAAGNAAGMFAHALVRESLLGELRSARRTRLHWLVGRAWSQRGGAAPAVVAHHLCEGSLAGDVGEAVAAALDAATAASRVGASEDQLRWAERASELLSDEPMTFPELHNRALFHRGSARNQMAEARRAAVDLVAAASLALDRSGHLLALRAIGPVVTLQVSDRAVTALARAVAEIPADTVAGGIARTMQAHVDGLRGRPFDVAEVEAVVAALGEEIPFDLVQRVHDSFMDMLIALPDLERTEQAHIASLAMGDRSSSPTLSASARIGLMAIAARRGDRGALEFERDRVREIFRVGLFRIVETYDIALAMADGRLDEAEMLARTSLESSGPESVMKSAFEIQLDWIASKRASGAHAPALSHSSERLRLAWRLGHSVQRARAGDLDAARKVGEAVVVVDLADPSLPMPIVDTLFALAEAVAFIGDEHNASLLIPRMEPYAGQLAFSYPLAGFWLPISSSLGRLRALSGATDLAVADCEAGLELAERMRAPLLSAESSLPLADVLLQRGRPSDQQRAQVLIDNAIEVAKGAGAHLVADMARQLRQR